MGFFDRFAECVAKSVSQAWFFTACVLLIVLWVPTIFLLPFDVSQLLVNTATTIITFLLVALLQNSQRRSDIATQTKLNAIAQGVLDLMEGEPDNYDRERLMHAVGLEQEVSAKDEAA